MIVCPVCEHAQAQGAECEVCGRRLAEGGRASAPVATLEGLEPTGHGAVSAPVERVPELEPTHHRPVHVLADGAPDLEPTRSAPVDVDVVATPDLERTAAEIPGDVPTALPAFVVCRYCRTPAMPGERLCSRCGMRLPFVVDAPRAATPPDAGRQCGCGMTVALDRASCPSCGARLRAG